MTEIDASKCTHLRDGSEYRYSFSDDERHYGWTSRGPEWGAIVHWLDGKRFIDGSSAHLDLVPPRRVETGWWAKQSTSMYGPYANEQFCRASNPDDFEIIYGEVEIRPLEPPKE